MRTALLIAICLSAGVVSAQPTNARVGQLAELRFERGSSELSPSARDTTQRSLGSVAAWALENPDGMIVIDGHADRTGTTPANVRLSLQRAESVRDELVDDYGLDPDQIVIAAYGGHQARQQVVIWGTRAGMDAIITRTMQKGHAVMWSGILTEADRRPSPAVPTQVTFR
jgi:hypothetical protein